MSTSPAIEYGFYGDNAKAFNSREPEVILAGPAGTGKTLVWLVKILFLASKYPGARILIVRKTRESLTESVLVTWERDVLGPDHPILRKNPTLRRVRQSYDMLNGSVVVVGGMDKPDKVLSSEWDLIYCPEATDLTLVDLETLSGRLRAGVVPFQQLCGDCNPTNPSHFLYRRHKAGLLKLYQSTHKDNPRFWDRKTGQWTTSGEQYLERLKRMTGARRKRFLDGIWATAEGLVYDGYSESIHRLPAGWRPPASWQRTWSIDWGFSNPLVLQMWAIDGDGRMYLYREFYRTQTRVEVLAKWAAEEVSSGREPLPTVAVCDHDPENAATFREHGPDGLYLVMADKTDKGDGIEAVQTRFETAGDDQPRIFFAADARDGEPDPALLDAGKPTCTVEELSAYIWDTRNPDRLKDEPLKANDHGCDAARYMTRWVDKNAQAGDDYTPSVGQRHPTTRLPAGTF